MRSWFLACPLSNPPATERAGGGLRYSQRMASGAEQEILTVAGREVAISSPRKVLFPQAGFTKLDLARYYIAVAEGALQGAGGRPGG